MIVILLGISAILLYAFGPNGPAWCLLNARKANPAVVEPRVQTRAYRFTPAQLEEIRDAEKRFEEVKSNSITSLIEALGEPDVVMDSEYEAEGYGARRYRYGTQWKLIDVVVYHYQGAKFSMQTYPKVRQRRPI